MNNQQIIVHISPYNRYIYYYNQFLNDVNNQLSTLWNYAMCIMHPYNAIIPATFRIC